jgi:hypothetical protein
LTDSYPEPYAPYVLKEGTLANGAFTLRQAYSSLGMAIHQISYYAGTDKLKVFMASLPNQRFSQVADINGERVAVSGEENGQALVIHPAGHEFLIVGYRCSVEFKHPEFRWPTMKNIRVEKGFWAGDQWNAEGEAEYGIDQSQDSLTVDLDSPQVVRVSW